MVVGQRCEFSRNRDNVRKLRETSRIVRCIAPNVANVKANDSLSVDTECRFEAHIRISIAVENNPFDNLPDFLDALAFNPQTEIGSAMLWEPNAVCGCQGVNDLRIDPNTHQSDEIGKLVPQVLAGFVYEFGGFKLLRLHWTALKLCWASFACRCRIHFVQLRLTNRSRTGCPTKLYFDSPNVVGTVSGDCRESEGVNCCVTVPARRPCWIA